MPTSECFHLLAEKPQLAPVRREFTPPVHIYSHRQHLIVYTLSEQISKAQGIVIVRVLRQSMEVSQQFASPD